MDAELERVLEDVKRRLRIARAEMRDRAAVICEDRAQMALDTAIHQRATGRIAEAMENDRVAHEAQTCAREIRRLSIDEAPS